MRRHWLKYTRATIGIAVLALFVAAFADFRGLVDAPLSHAVASVQFVPAALAFATGASAIVAVLAILVTTLAFGRIYCSVLCPLGLFQDAIARLADWIRRKPLLLRYAKPAIWVRQSFLWATVVGIAAGWAGLTLALLDPYSIFGRFGSMLFRPLVTVVNNWLVGPANAAGIDALYRVPPQWAAVGALALPAAMLLLVVVLAARRGRLYCNTVCPVGTLLGLLSGVGAWRLELDQQRCRKCGDCLRVCKAQCIDLRSGTIDASRCVACYNCVSACDKLGIHHRFKWKPETGDRKPETANRPPSTARRTPDTGTNHPSAPATRDPELRPRNSAPETQNPEPAPLNPSRNGASRRDFIAGTATALVATTGVGALLAATPATAAPTPDLPFTPAPEPVPPAPFSGNAVTPPGSGGIARFLDRCTACQLCVSACPTHVLQPAFLEYGVAGIMKPRLDFNHSFCNFECTRCADICPDSAILPLELEDKKLTRLGLAHIDYGKCVVKVNGTDCSACSEHCPTQAVNTVPFAGNLRLPQMHPELCIGCGACEYACPVRPERAIRITAQAVHNQAERKIEAPATAPRPSDEFPF